MTISEEAGDLARRIRALEDIEAIRRLKARYLNACDQQDPEAVRNCFAEGPVVIDMVHLGRYETRDDFVALFKAAGCHDFVLDMHHAANPEIDLLDETHAKALWGLEYRNINTRDRTVTFLSALYHDEYEKIGGAWKIRKTRTEFRSALHCNYADGVLEPLIAGRSVAEPPLKSAAE